MSQKYLFAKNKAFWDNVIKRYHRNDTTTELAENAVKLAEEVMYVNGCVKRGRGEDIEPEYPLKNVFEYIKELEQQLSDCQKESKGVVDFIIQSENDALEAENAALKAGVEELQHRLSDSSKHHRTQIKHIEAMNAEFMKQLEVKAEAAIKELEDVIRADMQKLVFKEKK